jgi:DNA-binding MarR family transcriptional regulator
MRESMDNVNQYGQAASPEEVFEVLHELMHLHRAQRQRAIETAGLAVSPLEARVLGFFARNPGATLTDLAAHSGRDKSQLARLIGSLRERGLLDARPDEQDRRNLRLQVTAAAEAVHRAMRTQMRRLAKAALADMDEEERMRFLASLRKVAQGMRRSGGQ